MFWFINCILIVSFLLLSSIFAVLSSIKWDIRNTFTFFLIRSYVVNIWLICTSSFLMRKTGGWNTLSISTTTVQCVFFYWDILGKSKTIGETGKLFQEYLGLFNENNFGVLFFVLLIDPVFSKDHFIASEKISGQQKLIIFNKLFFSCNLLP